MHTPGKLDKHILAVDKVASPVVPPAAGTPAIVAALVVDKVEKRWVETAVPLMSIQGVHPLHVRGA